MLDGEGFRAENERLYNKYLAGTLDTNESSPRAKKAASRTREAPVEAIGKALYTVTPEEEKGWLAHGGCEAEA